MSAHAHADQYCFADALNPLSTGHDSTDKAPYGSNAKTRYNFESELKY